jgi:hypothetical protein
VARRNRQKTPEPRLTYAPRECKYVVRVKAGLSDFPALFDVADKFANGSDRWAEIQPGYLAFHFEAQEVYFQFFKYAARNNLELIGDDDDMVLGKPVSVTKRTTSERFIKCRELVHDDAFEAEIALHMVEPLLKERLERVEARLPLRLRTFSAPGAGTISGPRAV